MKKVRLTKVFRFEMAHALPGYDGPCKNIHGHSYTFEVTVSGIPSRDESSTKLGMIMDFSDLKKIVEEEIIHPFDHALAIPKGFAPRSDLREEMHLGKVMEVLYQPTCENLLLDFVDRVTSRLPETVTLAEAKLWETATSCATWREEDQ